MSFLGLFYDLCFFRSRLNASQKNDVYFNFWCDFTRQRKKGHFLWFECFSNFGVYDFYRALEGLEAGNTRKWAEQLRLSVLCRGQYRSGRLARGHGPWIKCTYRSPTEGRDHSDLPYWEQSAKFWRARTRAWASESEQLARSLAQKIRNPSSRSLARVKIVARSPV